MGRRLYPLVWLLGMSMVSVVQAQNSRIALSRASGTTDFDLVTIKDDGTDPTQLTSEIAALRPSYSADGQRLLYDFDGDLWVVNTSGSPSPHKISDVSQSPCNGTPVCKDVDAGPVINEDGDFLVVFTAETTEGTTGSIWLATLDVSANELINFHVVTSGAVIDYHPAWCGDSHIIWSHLLGCEPQCEQSPHYWWDLCRQEVNEDGLVHPNDPPTCYLTSHQKGNQHPSCNSGGGTVAFAQSDGDTKNGDFYVEQPHKICRMRLTVQNPASTLTCLDSENGADDTNPVWSGDGTKLAFASERELYESTDYEIWKVIANFSPTTEPTSVTNNTVDDNFPDWGPALQ